MPTPRKTTDKRKTVRSQGIAAQRAQVLGEDRAGNDPYAPTVWGSAESLGTLQDLVLPSGQRCLAQRPGPEGLMAAGLLDDLDMLAGALPKASGAGKPSTPKFDPEVVMADPAMMRQAMALINRVTVFVVVKPEITIEPEDPRDKELGKIYPSSISLEDRMFLFNWVVGGTSNLEQFRQQLDESVASVESGEDVENAS